MHVEIYKPRYTRTFEYRSMVQHMSSFTYMHPQFKHQIIPHVEPLGCSEKGGIIPHVETLGCSEKKVKASEGGGR